MKESDLPPVGQETAVNLSLALFPTGLRSTPGSGSLCHSSPFGNQNKTTSLLYFWLSHIKNALVSDYYACHDFLKKSLSKSVEVFVSVSALPPRAATGALCPVHGELQGHRGNFQKGKPLFKISMYYPIT